MQTKMALVRTGFRLIFALILSVSMLGIAKTPTTARPTYSFTVTTEIDYNPAPADGTCYSGMLDRCGLREAVQEANVTGNAIINFSPDMAGKVINLSNLYGGGLFITNDYVTIDGAGLSSPVVIDGGGLAANSNILTITGDHNTVQYIKVQGWPDTRNPDWDYGYGIKITDLGGTKDASNNTINSAIVYGMEHGGIWVKGSLIGGGKDNRIENSLIGQANWASTTCVAGTGNRWDGIFVSDGAGNTVIYKNRIACNVDAGIFIDGSAGGQISGTSIDTNLIGTDGYGNDLGNSLGVHEWDSIQTTYQLNVISGNNSSGIWLEGSSYANIILNMIGLDPTGYTALPNGGHGIYLTNGAQLNTIGSATVANYRNVISGNSQAGIQLESGATQNQLDGNYIGLDKDGNLAVPNGMVGIALYSANSNVISTADATVNQYISGNTGEGIYIQDSSGVSILQKTRIGTHATSDSFIPNVREGIRLVNVTNSVIKPGYVAGNGRAGIAVEGAASSGNVLMPTLVGVNGGLPIDLGNDGPTANDGAADDDSGPNGLLNYPVITANYSVRMSGTKCSGCSVNVYFAVGDPTANGGGAYFYTTYPASAETSFMITTPLGRSNLTFQSCRSTAPFDCSELSPAQAYTNPISIYLPNLLKVRLP